MVTFRNIWKLIISLVLISSCAFGASTKISAMTTKPVTNADSRLYIVTVSTGGYITVEGLGKYYGTNVIPYTDQDNAYGVNTQTYYTIVVSNFVVNGHTMSSYCSALNSNASEALVKAYLNLEAGTDYYSTADVQSKDTVVSNGVTAFSLAQDIIVSNALTAFTLAQDIIISNALNSYVLAQGSIESNGAVATAQAYSLLQDIIISNSASAYTLAQGIVISNSASAYTLAQDTIVSNALIARIETSTNGILDAAHKTVSYVTNTVTSGSGVLNGTNGFWWNQLGTNNWITW